MSLYKIELCGCDDTTSFMREMTDEELDFLVTIAIEANKTSTYGCMPTMHIYEMPKINLDKAKEIYKLFLELDEDTGSFDKFVANNYECEQLMEKII